MTRSMDSLISSMSWLTTRTALRRRAQEVHDEQLGLGVEVVGGLVEDRAGRHRREQAGQLQAPALAAGEGADLGSERLVVEADAVGDAAGLGLGLVATEALNRSSSTP